MSVISHSVTLTRPKTGDFHIMGYAHNQGYLYPWLISLLCSVPKPNTKRYQYTNASRIWSYFKRFSGFIFRRGLKEIQPMLYCVK